MSLRSLEMTEGQITTTTHGAGAAQHFEQQKTEMNDPNPPTAQPWAHECWATGAAQRGIHSGFITHSVAMVCSDDALSGL
ncbi:MAG: hypothetical protein WC647_07675 [Desulfomonilaceae bacterium]